LSPTVSLSVSTSQCLSHRLSPLSHSLTVSLIDESTSLLCLLPSPVSPTVSPLLSLSLLSRANAAAAALARDPDNPNVPGRPQTSATAEAARATVASTSTTTAVNSSRVPREIPDVWLPLAQAQVWKNPSLESLLNSRSKPHCDPNRVPLPRAACGWRCAVVVVVVALHFRVCWVRKAATRKQTQDSSKIGS
jgi:hypothetical protein